MSALSHQILSVISVAAITSLIFAALGDSRFKEALKSICALAVLSALISSFAPVIEVITTLTSKNEQLEISPDHNVDNSVLINDIGKNLCLYTEDMLYTRFGISRDDCTVGVTINEDDGGNISLKTVTVEFLSVPPVSPALISDYITETLMCECIIILNSA